MEPFEFKKRMQSLGWSYAEAARRLGVSRGTISRWVRGERRIPETAIRLIDILGEGRTEKTRTELPLSGTTGLSPFERDLLQKLVSQFSNIPNVHRILLFGSRARGLSDEHSDLDVAVVTDTMDPASTAAVEEAKWEALTEDSFLYANVITIPAEQLAADTAFSRALNEEGIEIWTRSEKAR
jgi:transcriptional regulator with XRE-family HTH domain